MHPYLYFILVHFLYLFILLPLISLVHMKQVLSNVNSNKSYRPTLYLQEQKQIKNIKKKLYQNENLINCNVQSKEADVTQFYTNSKEIKQPGDKIFKKFKLISLCKNSLMELQDAPVATIFYFFKYCCKLLEQTHLAC